MRKVLFIQSTGDTTMLGRLMAGIKEIADEYLIICLPIKTELTESSSIDTAIEALQKVKETNAKG